MNKTLRMLFMGFCIHLLVSAFLLAGIRVMHSGYNRMHSEPIEAASLRADGENVELQVLTETMTIPLDGMEKLPMICYLSADTPVQLWVGVILKFINLS